MADAIFKQCLDRVVTDIKALALTGVKSYNVVTRWMPWDSYHFEEGITVHPAKEAITDGAGTAGRDDIGYGCQVTMVQANHSDLTANMNQHLQWQESIRKKFMNQRLGAITSVMKCTVQVKDVPIPKAFIKENYLTHALIVRAWSRETRG